MHNLALLRLFRALQAINEALMKANKMFMGREPDIAFKLLEKHQEVSIIECSQIDFTKEFFDLLLYGTSETDEVITRIPRLIDSYKISLRIQTKIECKMLIILIKECVKQNSIILFENIKANNIDEYYELFNQLYD